MGLFLLLVHRLAQQALQPRVALRIRAGRGHPERKAHLQLVRHLSMLRTYSPMASGATLSVRTSEAVFDFELAVALAGAALVMELRRGNLGAGGRLGSAPAPLGTTTTMRGAGWSGGTGPSGELRAGEDGITASLASASAYTSRLRSWPLLTAQALASE
jgi:hypothetical protein